MSAAPELVFQQGIKMGWLLLEKYPRVLGFLLEYFPVSTQENYAELLRGDKMSERIAFVNPKSSVMIPNTVILPQGKAEDLQFLGDGGLDSYNPNSLPHPALHPEDYPDIERHFGLMSGLSTSPQFIKRGGERSADPTTFHDQIKLNRGIQRSWGDEQRTQMGMTRKVFNAMTQYIEGRSVIDRVTVTASVRTDNGEKTLVYTDLLYAVLREYSLWFHLNGLMNPTFSMGPLTIDDSLAPSTSGDPPVLREIQMVFQHEDRFHDIRPVIAKFMIDVQMITPRTDGGEDSTQVASIETSGDSIMTPPPPFDLNDP